jgi:cobalt/nickel transport system permease protein
MHHAYLDKFASGDSPLHRRDPRAKTVAFFALLAVTVLVPVGVWWPLAAIAAALGLLWLASGVPAGYLLKRVVALSPFMIFSVVFFPFFQPGDILWRGALGSWPIHITRQGLELSGNIAAKFALSVLILGLLFSVTRFQHFLYALREFRVPQMLVMQLGFLYRYLFIIHDEAERMWRAREARSGGRGGWLLWRATGGLIGSLFLRSFARSQRIYWAMLARGFSGEVHVLQRLRFGVADGVLIAATVLVAGGIIWVWIIR